MCIICAKAKGVEMPTQDVITNMWNRNPDGAGFMYAKDGKVVIRKGFMTLADLNKGLAEAAKDVDFKSTGVVLHFRITTHGGTCPANTHPFPITDNVKRLQMTATAADVGVAHNGIINNKPRSKDISDTMEYIASVLAPMKRSMPNFYTDNNMLDLIANTINGSRMCFLNGDGDVVTVGTWHEVDGLKYSNTSYQGYTWRHSTSYKAPIRVSYDDAYDDDFAPWWENGNTVTATKKTSTKTSKKSSKKTSKKDKKDTNVVTYMGQKPLMYVSLSDPDGYITTDSNLFLEGDDFAIDRDGKVYQYNFDLDACVYCEDYRAWTKDGKSMQYKDGDAFTEYVVDLS